MIIVGRVEFGDDIKIVPVRTANSVKDTEILWRNLGISIGPAPSAPPVDFAELHHRNADAIRRLIRRTLSCS